MVQVVEQVTIDWFLRALPPEECMAAGMRAPQTPVELVDTLEHTLLNLDLSKQKTVKIRPGATGMPAPTSWTKTGPQMHLPYPTPSPGHLDKPMPSASEQPLSIPARKPWLANYFIHSPASPHFPSIPVWVEGQPVEVLLVSGSTITLVWPSVLPVAVGHCGAVNVTCMHEDAQEVATTNIKIGDERDEWNLTVGVVPDLPVALLLG